MTLRGRLATLFVLAGLALAALVLARRHAPALVEAVVEHSLVQKASGPGVDPAEVRSRFHADLDRRQDPEARLARVFELARTLEKVQRLDRAGLNRLLP